MNKPAKPEAEAFDDLSDLYGPLPTEAEMEAWIARNRDEINASLVEARREFAEGKAEPLDLDEMLSDLRAEFANNSKP